jgi:hypothetical protein
MTYNNNKIETTITMTNNKPCQGTYRYFCQPPAEYGGPAGGLPTQAQNDSLDEARVPRRGVHAVLECCPRRNAQESHWTWMQPEIRWAGWRRLHCEAVGCQ